MKEIILELESRLPAKRWKSERSNAVEVTALKCKCGENNVNAVLRGDHENDKVIEYFYPLYRQKLEDAIAEREAACAQIS